MADFFSFILKGIFAVILCIILLRGIMLAVNRHARAKSGDRDTKAQALYELGNERWDVLNGKIGLIHFLISGSIPLELGSKEHVREQAVNYWIEAANLGHQGAEDKLTMVRTLRH